jgi:hypothetical protein
MRKIDLTEFKKLRGVTRLDDYCSKVDDEVSQSEERSYFSDAACAIGALVALLFFVFSLGFLVSFFFENPKFFLFLLGVIGFISLLRWMKGIIDRCEVETYHFRVRRNQ